MDKFEHGKFLWENEVKQELNKELKILNGVFGNVIIKIDDLIVGEIRIEQFQDMFTSGPKSLETYYDFGKVIVKEYKRKIKKQFLIDCVGHA